MIEFSNSSVRDLMDNNGMTPTEFARHTSVSRQTIMQHINNDCQPTIDVLLKYCNACDEQPNYFFKFTDVIV